MAKKEKVAEKSTEETQEAVETKMANKDGKLKVKKKTSMKRMDFSDEPIKVDMSNPPVDETQPKEEEQEVKEEETPVVEEVVEEVKPPKKKATRKKKSTK